LPIAPADKPILIMRDRIPPWCSRFNWKMSLFTQLQWEVASEEGRDHH
jgi:hypothetical protein